MRFLSPQFAARRLALLGLFAAAHAFAAERVITTVAEIRALTTQEAARHYPVHLKAVITQFIPSAYLYFLQDSTGGIYFNWNVGQGPQVERGDEVEVDAFTDPGSFSPSLQKTHFKVIGKGRMPQPKIVQPRQLGTGVLDANYVQVRGLVRSFSMVPIFEGSPDKRLLLVLRTDSGAIQLQVTDFAGTDLQHIVGEEIIVTGVLTVRFNKRNQLSGEYVSVASTRDIVVTRREKDDPLTQQPRPILSLMTSVAGSEGLSRVRIRGAITLSEPGHLAVIQAGRIGLRVNTNTPGAFPIGTLVDVIGFPNMGAYSPQLLDATVQAAALPGARSGPALTTIQPVVTTADEAKGGLHDYELVKIRGEAVAQIHDRDRQVLWVRSGNYTFSASFDGRHPVNAVDGVQNGSIVDVTGVCVTLASEENKDPIGFRMIIRSDSDVTVFRAPPIWQSGRTLQILGGTVLLAALVLGWNLLLRRRVKMQTEQLARQLKQESALEGRYRDLFENATDMIYTHDMEGNFISLNHAGETITGYSRTVAQSSNIFDWAVPDQRAHLRRIMDRLNSGVDSFAFELDIITGNKGRATLEITSRRIVGQDAVQWIEGIARDCTGRKRNAQFEVDRNAVLEMTSRNEHLPQILAKLAELAQKQVDGSAAAVMLADGNELACAAAPALDGVLMDMIASTGIGPRTTATGAALYWGRLIATHNIASDPTWGEPKTLALRQGWRACWSAPIFSAQERLLGTLDLYLREPGAPDRAQLSLLDACARMAGIAIERRDLYERLTKLSQHDALTGLPNRVLMEDRLDQALSHARRNGNRVACLYIDLDGFKNVNDTMGHKVGDLVLQSAVSRLKASIRESDTLARIGGDEFLIVLPDLERLEEAEIVAEQLVRNLHDPLNIDGYPVRIGASIGISVFPDHGEDTASLQRNADIAMYRAKRFGKGRAEIFGPESQIAVSLEKGGL